MTLILNAQVSISYKVYSNVPSTFVDNMRKSHVTSDMTAVICYLNKIYLKIVGVSSA